ncbi:MAG: RES domain-containing protein [Chloroflexota bacterium]
MGTGRPALPTFGAPDPIRLTATAPDVFHLTAGSRLWRIYFRGGRYPPRWNGFCFTGPSDKSRFDHHEKPARQQERGILYCASFIPTCVAEVFQRDRTIDRAAGEPWLVAFETVPDIPLLNLTG